MADVKSELEEIKRDGATPQPNSGRGKHRKGDAILEPFIVDYKEYSKSFGISKAVWAKICTDANYGHKQPALKLVLGDNDGQKIRLWVISDSMFHEMRHAWITAQDVDGSRDTI